MFAIRPYDGSPDDLARFVVETWRHDYAGKMTFPLWSADYLRWQLRLDDPAARHHQLAAYHEGRLVGALLGAPSRFRTPQGVLTGHHGSWLSIAPEFRSQGMVGQLTRERVRQQAEHGDGLVVGYRFVGSKHSLAERPDPTKLDLSRSFHAKLGFWARVLNAPRAARWNVAPFEAFLTRIGGPFTPDPKAPKTDAIRPYRPDDLPACVAHLARTTAKLPLTIDWTPEDLAHQLAGSSLAQTWVYADGAEVRGLVNFHILPFLARTEEAVGVIDILSVDELSAANAARLTNAALKQMQDQGAILALKLRCGDCPWGTMLRTHFVPRLPDSWLVLQWIQAPQSIASNSNLHLLWR
jgi:hypothetical protein